VVLDASHNKITASAIDLEFPVGLTRLDLSGNPMGINDPRSATLLQKLASLARLKELRFENAEIGDDALPPTLFSSAPFPSLRMLDFGQTKVTLNGVKAALKGMKQEVSYDVTADDPPPGVARVIIGKKVVKEAWELELEQRGKARAAKSTDIGDWQATASGSAPSTEPAKKPQREVLKEDWEIEAEQGLLSEGGQRRARAAAATSNQAGVGNGIPSTASSAHSSNQSTSGPLLAKYYSEQLQTLKLPESSPPAKARATHARTFSLAHTLSSSTSVAQAPRNTDLAAPAPTLPLSVIVSQPFAHVLRVLILKSRRMDKTFSLPLAYEGQETFLPNLEELDLSNCGLSDLVNVTRSASNSVSSSITPSRSSEPILPLIAKLFPSLRSLTLSENFLTSTSLTFEALSTLILSTGERKGLKRLRLNGNRINELDGFQELASLFKGNREVPGWKLDELDVSDNNIAKLPPELGLFPLDEFSVERNT
jgi:Leucine-rich repeat (LRR) protein